MTLILFEVSPSVFSWSILGRGSCAAAPWEVRAFTQPTLNTSSTRSSGCSRNDRFGKDFNKCRNGESHVKASVILPQSSDSSKRIENLLELLIVDVGSFQQHYNEDLLQERMWNHYSFCWNRYPIAIDSLTWVLVIKLLEIKMVIHLWGDW